MNIAFIGAGKVGIALGMYFRKSGLNVVGYYSRSYNSAQKAALLTESMSYQHIEEVSNNADIIFITTTDDQIEDVDRTLAKTTTINKNHIVAHTSGAHASNLLKELKKIGCSVYSIHPLQSFADPEITLVKLPTTVFTIEGDKKDIDTIKRLFKITNNKYFVISESVKPLYHAGACIVSNYLVTLISIGFDLFEKAGIDRNEIYQAIEPLILGTLNNIKKVDTTEALTGPIVRGDEKTIKSHLQTIEANNPESLDFYKYLGEKTIDMCQGRMEPQEADKIRKRLREGIIYE